MAGVPLKLAQAEGAQDEQDDDDQSDQINDFMHG
jgi:hypothetical protein